MAAPTHKEQMMKTSEHDEALARELAHSFGYLTEDDICALFKITRGTAAAWRKRHIGPWHITTGNRPLYPREAVQEELDERKRNRCIELKRRAALVKDLL